MKFLLFIALTVISLTGYSQSVVGKWKPVFFSMDTIFRADMKADTFYINPVMKEQFKDDKDPVASEEMMTYMLKMLYKKTKAMQEEYTPDGKYAETNTESGRVKSGTYSYDPKTGKMEKTVGLMEDKQQFTLSWKGDRLVLTSELGERSGKKGKLEVIYEKI